MSGYCKGCGAEECPGANDKWGASPDRHVNEPNPIGYCEDCGRNGLSCECDTEYEFSDCDCDVCEESNEALGG